jgi:hypothetical protein
MWKPINPPGLFWWFFFPLWRNALIRPSGMWSEFRTGVLRVNEQPIRIRIIGAKVACSQGLRDDWRDVAQWTASKLIVLYGDKFDFKYYDILDNDCPVLPANAKLPIVSINGEVISMGGKISIPLICKKIESINKG